MESECESESDNESDCDQNTSKHRHYKWIGKGHCKTCTCDEQKIAKREMEERERVEKMEERKKHEFLLRGLRKARRFSPNDWKRIEGEVHTVDFDQVPETVRSLHENNHANFIDIIQNERNEVFPTVPKRVIWLRRRYCGWEMFVAVPDKEFVGKPRDNVGSGVLEVDINRMKMKWDHHLYGCPRWTLFESPLETLPSLEDIITLVKRMDWDIAAKEFTSSQFPNRK